MPKITIIVPVYNVEKYLNRCVDSILSQTFTDFDIILVNDGSSDNSGSICDYYQRQDSRVNVIHKANKGVADTRNTGLEWAYSHSDSMWVGFVDSDDWIHPQYLELLYHAVTSTGFGMSICGHLETEQNYIEQIEYHPSIVSMDAEKAFCDYNLEAIVPWGKLYFKEDFKGIRYPNVKIFDDEFTTYKVLFKNKKIVYVDAPLYYYFLNPKSLMHADWNPSRLIALKALKDQTAYFDKNHYPVALKQSFHAYADYIVRSIDIISGEHNYYIHNKKLRFKLKQYLLKYRRKLNLTVKEYAFYYEYAFPCFMKYYWILKSKINK